MESMVGRKHHHHHLLFIPGRCPGFWDATVHS
uniref:Uncharacterized protein n=1 Tax=Arundo donax TaxID=35708 RepID=A0A0A8XZ97_ARUDO